MSLKNVIGLGVAGNFAKHLEQAGELKDFEHVVTKEADAPKGIFPFYLPGSKSFLGTYCIGTDHLKLPAYEANAQVEPEIALLCEIVYDETMRVADLMPQAFTTFNDCTIRKEGAKKISEKKNWGADSKGIGDKWIQRTESSHVSYDTLFRDLGLIRKNGWAVDIEEHAEGVCAVGVSIQSSLAERYAIAVALPVIRFNKNMTEVTSALLQCQAEVEEVLKR